MSHLELAAVVLGGVVFVVSAVKNVFDLRQSLREQKQAEAKLKEARRRGDELEQQERDEKHQRKLERKAEHDRK